MTWSVAVRPLAEHDLLEAQEWYEEQRAGLATEFREEVVALFNRLAERPFAYPTVHRNVRRAVLRRFPYLIYFTAGAQEVTVLACLHSSRDSRLHKNRTR